MSDSATPWTAARQVSLSFIISQSLLKLVHWVDDAIQPSHLLLSPYPPAFNLSQQGSFPMSWFFVSFIYMPFQLRSPQLHLKYVNWFSLKIYIFSNSVPHLFTSLDQISRSVVSNSLWPHESQHARPPCPSTTPGVHWDSRPLSQWCHPAISSSVVTFSSCPQSLPASESFPVTQFFAWGGQSTGVSALASVLPKKSRADLLQNGLVGSPCSPRDSQESSPTPQFNSINSSGLSLLHSPTLTSIHDHRKNHSLD